LKFDASMPEVIEAFLLKLPPQILLDHLL
jgi:hypothetical protein